MIFNVVAYNVHSGGGSVLLDEILSHLPYNMIVNLWADARYAMSENAAKINVYRVRPTVISRLIAEWTISRTVKPQDIHFIFGNLPPLFKSKAHSVVFLQNRLLLDTPVVDLSLIIKRNFRLFFEKIWFRVWQRNAAAYLVQTESMARSLQHAAGSNARIYIMPFMSNRIKQKNVADIVKVYDYIYPASGEPHKNHINLLLAWIELSKNGLRPSLLLTLDRDKYPDIVRRFDLESSAYELNIKIISCVGFNDMENLYNSSKALIYPSLTESFGLPLLEANDAGLDIIASELDYVRDVSVPVQTFDPTSSLSIARAVERHLLETTKIQKIYQASDIVSFLMSS